MCNEAVDDSLAALKLILDWFVTSKLIKKLFTILLFLILLFLSDFWLGILNLKSAKNIKTIYVIPIDGGIGACQKMRKKK